MMVSFQLKVNMEGGGAVDIKLNVSNSTITFSKMPDEMAAEDYAAMNAFLAAAQAFMRNPRMLKAVIERAEE